MNTLTVKTFAELEKINPFRRPDWRWERVLSLCDRIPTPGRCSRKDDEYVRKARNFLLRYRQAPESERQILAVEYPGLYLGYRYHETSIDYEDIALIIQARILARQTVDDIAQEDGTHPEAISWYEKLFFNIMDRLDQHDYILKHVLLPAVGRGYVASHTTSRHSDSPWAAQAVGLPYGDMMLKFFAYYGGPAAVDILLSGFRRGFPCASAEDFDGWCDKVWATTVKRRTSMAAHTFEVNKFNITELFAVNARLIEIANSAETEDRARTQVEQHILSFMKSIPWAMGNTGNYAQGQKGLQLADESVVELRDDELLLTASGTKPSPLDGLDIQELPAPQRKQEVVPAAKGGEE